MQLNDGCYAHLSLSNFMPSKRTPAVIHLSRSDTTIGRLGHVKLDMQGRQYMVSREHARFSVRKLDKIEDAPASDPKAAKFEVCISDLKSLNGTLLNGERIDDQPRTLHNGDVVTFGGAARYKVGECCLEPDSSLVYKFLYGTGPTDAVAASMSICKRSYHTIQSNLKSHMQILTGQPRTLLPLCSRPTRCAAATAQVRPKAVFRICHRARARTLRQRREMGKFRVREGVYYLQARAHYACHAKKKMQECILNVCQVMCHVLSCDDLNVETKSHVLNKQRRSRRSGDKET